MCADKVGHSFACEIEVENQSICAHAVCKHVDEIDLVTYMSTFIVQKILKHVCTLSW